jgi:beta-catenin-like protein 1
LRLRGVQEAELFASDLKDLENIDGRGIKRVVAGLERRIRKNQELRMKHADEPQRFLESEIALHEVLRKLMALAGEPALYMQLVSQKCLPLLLELLQHGNMDIVSAAIDLLTDLTDADSVEDVDEVWLQTVHTFRVV